MLSRATSLALAAAVSLAALPGCSTTSPDVVQRGDATRATSVADATVLSVRAVTIEGNQSGLGAIAGGVVGGVAGSSVGGRREAVAVGMIASVLGGVVGNAIERNATRENALEILVQMRSGERRALVQARGGEDLRPGDAVLIVGSGGSVRVVRAPAGSAGTGTGARN